MADTKKWMIQANELMIGNWVKFHSKFEKVTLIDGDGYINLSQSDIIPDSSIGLSGIPLTEEILLKCGFEVIDDNPKQKPHYKGDILFKVLDFEFTNSMCDGFKCYQINNGETIIKSLHQLQNLFHALTGQELTINF